MERVSKGDFSVLFTMKLAMYKKHIEEAGTTLRILSAGKRLRSFSWHLRGKTLAMIECLQEAWRLAKKDYSVECPCEFLWAS